MTNGNVGQPEQRQTHLIVPQDEAEQRIRAQIREGEELLNNSKSIQSKTQLLAAKNGYEDWREYTRALLKRRIFDTDELADEFAPQFDEYGYIGVPYTLRVLQDDLQRDLSRLRRIYKQVEQGLFPVKAPQPPPTEDEAGKKSGPIDRCASGMGQIYDDKIIQVKEERQEPWLRKAMGIFFAYAREDEELRDELQKHLSILERQGAITSWHDRKIGAGKEWKGEIDTHLNTARVILLLISPDFIASDYCWDVEVKRAMERHEAGEARVIPVILRSVEWRDAPFGKLQALPTDAKPVTSWENRDEAFLDIAQGIRAAVMELRAGDNRAT